MMLLLVKILSMTESGMLFKYVCGIFSLVSPKFRKGAEHVPEFCLMSNVYKSALNIQTE